MTSKAEFYSKAEKFAEAACHLLAAWEEVEAAGEEVPLGDWPFGEKDFAEHELGLMAWLYGAVRPWAEAGDVRV